MFAEWIILPSFENEDLDGWVNWIMVEILIISGNFYGLRPFVWKINTKEYSPLLWFEVGVEEFNPIESLSRQNYLLCVFFFSILEIFSVLKLESKKLEEIFIFHRKCWESTIRSKLNCFGLRYFRSKFRQKLCIQNFFWGIFFWIFNDTFAFENIFRTFFFIVIFLLIAQNLI